MREIAHEAQGDLERLKKRLLTVKDFGDKLKGSEKTIYSYVGQNRLPDVKIESNVRFNPNVISGWLKAKLSAPPGSKGASRAGISTSHEMSRPTGPTDKSFEVFRSVTIRRYSTPALQARGTTPNPLSLPFTFVCLQ